MQNNMQSWVWIRQLLNIFFNYSHKIVFFNRQTDNLWPKFSIKKPAFFFKHRKYQVCCTWYKLHINALYKTCINYYWPRKNALQLVLKIIIYLFTATILKYTLNLTNKQDWWVICLHWPFSPTIVSSFSSCCNLPDFSSIPLQR